MYSKLAQGIIETPNKTKRTQPIDSFCIHHMAGTSWTGKRCAESFAVSSRQASANYCIGKTGLDDIWASCPEEFRAWTSGTGNVPNGDQRVITFELANDSGAPDWHVSDATIEACIQVMVDCCNRYGIKEVKWSDDKETRKTKGYLYFHRDWQATSCPGPYLVKKIPEYIIPEVNKRLGNVSPVTPEPVKPTTTFGEEDIWNYFKSSGMTDAGVAGVMGNLYAESGIRANNLQNSYEKKFGLSDEQYTAGVDNGTYTNFVRDSAGYGLAQWTYWSRKQGLYNFVKSKGVSIGDTKTQCEFLISEIKGYTCWKVITTTDSVKEASDAVLTSYEKPANQSDEVKNKRYNYSMNYYNKYHKNDTPVTPVQPVTPTKSALDVAREIWYGVNGVNPWGNGKERMTKLEAAGYDYVEVQSYVNQLAHKMIK